PSKRYRLRDIVPDLSLSLSPSELLKLNIPLEVIEMTPSRSISYHFAQFREFSTWGPYEAYLSLINCGANVNLINEEWVLNHYQLIVWKIASMVRSFPYEFSSWWCVEKVLEQLQYRYEREINCAQRSVLKLIIEGDGNASLPMVLCVSRIYEYEDFDSA
ncbi:5281_t:CDS:2, partial [Acaulospora morrowiae]